MQALVSGRRAVAAAASATILAVTVFFGCSPSREQGGTGGTGGAGGAQPARTCQPARSSEQIPLRRSMARTTLTVTVDDLKTAIDARCQQCHLVTETGGFQYSDDYATGDAKHPGLSEAAERMAAALQSGKMPPNNTDPEGSQALLQTLQAWIQAGKPDGAFQGPQGGGAQGTGGGFGHGLTAAAAEGMTNLGTCIPDAATLPRPGGAGGGGGSGSSLDSFFATATELPKDLADTDMTSFDALTLADRGVFAYVPTYPLWSDDALKLRMIKVPQGEAITFDPKTGTFHIPPNTRFYKTFFKKVVEPDGHVGSKPIETRLIVSRPSENGVEKAVFGTYIWEDDESRATLWDGVYRDGEPFRDRVFQYTDAFQSCEHDASGKVVTDPMTGAPKCDAHQRTYAIPAKHRCVQCHKGAEGQNFVLGFTPLQINRRPSGEGGVVDPVGDDELDQVQRLSAYGVLKGVDAARLPRLESSAGARMPRNIHELRAQAYVTGNCAHCHNPRGFPVQDNPALADFNLAPGGIVFQFPLHKPAVSTLSAQYVDPLNMDLGVAAASLIYRRVATPKTTVFAAGGGATEAHIVAQHMPANTPGMDCRAPDILGRWIVSIPVDPAGNAVDGAPEDENVKAAALAAEQRVAQFSTGCVAPPDVSNWVQEDLTEPTVYVPRRADFNEWTSSEDSTDPLIHPDAIHGMPKMFRDLKVDESVAKVARTRLPYGYWTWKPQCHFPGGLPQDPDDPSNADSYRRPWMLTSEGQPKRPLGEVYLSTPGGVIFKAVCSNCHGARADGNSGNAKALLQLSDGKIQVANLVDGLFGPRSNPGANLPLFDAPGPGGQSIGPYGAAKYLVWMTSGGTRVKFPDGFESLLGAGDSKFGGNMATKIGYYCSRLLPQQLWVGTLALGDPFASAIPEENREVWQALCGLNNQAAPAPGAPVPPGFDAESWIRTARANGGLMMYFFFRDQTSHDVFPPSAAACEQAFPEAP